MPTTIDLLKYSSMTPAVNRIKSPNAFLQKLLWSNHQTLPTETIEISYLDGDRKMAPFVLKNGEAISVDGLGDTFATVEAPNIRIKRTMEAATLAFKRQPTVQIFASAGQMRSGMQSAVARDLQYMSDQVTNTIEWMCAQAITGTIEYNTGSVMDPANRDIFKITFPKPASHTATLSPASRDWDATPEILEDLLDVKEAMAVEDGIPQDCILAGNVARAFIKDEEVLKQLDRSNVEAGGITFLEQFSQDGVIYLGAVSGIRFWMYPRTMTDPAGNQVKMIRDNYAEFVHTAGASDNIMYFGAIPEVVNGSLSVIQSERFSKGWIREDPANLTGLLATRPLPVPRRPSMFYSLKCIGNV